MVNNTNEHAEVIMPKIEPFIPVVADYDRQVSTASSLLKSTSSNMDTSDDEAMQEQAVDLTHGIKRENQSETDAVELPFDPSRWLIPDPSSGKLRAPRQNEFLYLLLEDSQYSSYLSWLDRTEGLFKIHQPDRVVQLWVKVKSRHTHGTMDYDTFARGLRYYYQIGAMIKTHRKYTFRFKLS